MSIEAVFVAGAGLMGHGIAQVHAAIGKRVILYEPDLARAVAGRDRIAGNLDRAVAKGKLGADDRDATLGRIEATADPALAASADLVVEAIFEDLEVKRTFWAPDRRARPGRRDLRLEHELDLDRRARRGGRSGSAGPPSSGCTSSARCR